jgi:prepilin-type N-terminal cleavage/methylation domain-containing protein/prepilin-type processing-associated H-X9-DG protein
LGPLPRSLSGMGKAGGNRVKTTSMNNRPTSQSPRGFTLVELLVVVVIIGTLGILGILGARAALAASRQSACMENMRNIGAAIHLYAVDHDGMFPETTHSTDLDGAWVYSLEAYLGDFDHIRVCPADPRKAQRLKARGTSYLLNSYIFVPEMDPFGEPVGPALNRVSAIPEPSRTIIAFICSDATGTGPGNDHTHSNQWSSWSTLAGDICPWRFGGSESNTAIGRSNYLFVDGRVESIPAADVKRRINAGINIAKPPGVPGLE